MIEKMHEKSKGIAFKVIFAFISISFVLGGIGGGMMTHDTSAVKVNGDEISQQNFTQAKSSEQNLRNAQEGKHFWERLEDPAYAAEFNQSVLNRLINDQLLRQYAQTLNLGISAEQIKSEIVNNPNFQQDGKFNNGLYLQTLRNNGLSAEGYAAIVAEGMLMAQLQEGIIQTEFSTPAQQDVLAKLLLQQREIRRAVYPLAPEMSKQSVNDDELQAFYEQHKNRFTTPEKLTVEYVSLSQKAIAEKVQVDDAQIQTYYDANKAKYTTAGETQFAHIQFAAQDEAEQALQALKNGEDFAKLAAEKSQDKGSAVQGGDLGWAKAGTFPPEFENAAATLAVGQISNVVKIDNAFHIIKILNRKAESVIPLDSLKAQIRQTIHQELARNEYAEKAREMANKAFESNNSLTEVAEIAGLSVQTTEAFDEAHIPAVLQNERITQTLFNSELRKNGQNFDALELGDEQDPYTMFVRVSHYQPEAIQAFDAAKEAVSQAVKRTKAEQQLMEKAQADLKALEAGENPAVKFDEPAMLTFAETQFTQPEQAKVIFSMPKAADKPTYQIVRDRNGDVVIIGLDKVIEGDPSQFTPLAEQLAQADQIVLYSNLLQELRARAKVEINEVFLEQQLNDR